MPVSVFPVTENGVETSLKIALGSLGVSFVVLAVKYGAYAMTGSVALYADALESIINVATAVAAIVAIRMAARPADAEHPYGHHKAEYLTAVGVGALIVMAALAILREAYFGFLAPKAIETPWLGIGISTVATVLNIGWSSVLVRQGRKQRSAALVSDGKHLMADVVTSVGVLVGVLLVIVTGIELLDAAIAALVALHVLWSGWSVMRENASGLLDEAVPVEELALIEATISDNSEDVIEVHDLRTRHSGKLTFVEFHMVVKGSMTVTASHTICDRLEMALKAAVPGAMVTIHVEPENKAKVEIMRR